MQVFVLHAVWVDGDSWAHLSMLSVHATLDSAEATARAHRDANPTRSVSYGRGSTPNGGTIKVATTDDVDHEFNDDQLQACDYVIQITALRGDT